jgi:hypothetical protein
MRSQLEQPLISLDGKPPNTTRCRESVSGNATAPARVTYRSRKEIRNKQKKTPLSLRNFDKGEKETLRRRAYENAIANNRACQICKRKPRNRAGILRRERKPNSVTGWQSIYQIKGEMIS